MRRRLFAMLLATVVAAIWIGAAAGASSAKTVWLCKPGQAPDPCAPGLSTTLYNPSFKKTIGVERPKAPRNPTIDCFYVYPTVSEEKTGNSDLRIQSLERGIALYQVGRYSQDCRVYAPMYRQVTLAGAGLAPATTKANPALAFSDVEHAFADYLAHYNHGRGFVLIGQSQGALELRLLMMKMVDSKPAVRHRLVSAILLGGNVLVKGNTGIGGDFKHVPACRRNTQLGCVIAFSTYDQPVPSDSLFGRPLALLGSPKPSKDEQVLCTNPANLAGGSGLLEVSQPSAPFVPGSKIAGAIGLLNWPVPAPSTPFWASPRAYTGRCVDSNGAHVLMVKARAGAETPSPSPTPAWGLHLLDAQIALGNLVSIVKSESAALLRSGH